VPEIVEEGRRERAGGMLYLKVANHRAIMRVTVEPRKPRSSLP
jgi:hypothetical protein